MVPSDIMEHCRLCLVKESVSINIFENENEIRQLYFKIIACLPIRLSRQDQRLPKKICASCNLKVDELYQFWTQTANTEKTLERWISEADQAQAVTLTKIKCEFDADMPITKIEPRDHSSDDGDRGMDGFDDNYRDDSDVPDTDFEPNSMMHVTYEDVEPSGDIDRKPKKIIKKKSESANKSSNSKTTPISCTLCDKEVMSEGKLKDHIRKIHINSHEAELLRKERIEKPKSQCPYCTKTFSKKEKLLLHVDKSHADVDTVNDESKTALERALLSLDDGTNPTLQCQSCKKYFCGKDKLARHIRTAHTDRMLKCEICQEEFDTRKLFNKHKATEHEKEKHSFECACGYNTDKKFRLTEHIRRKHLKDYKVLCPICGFGCFRNAELKEHIMSTHSEDRPKCEICQKTFARHRNLKLHNMRFHDKSKNTLCPHCGKGFASQGRLNEHMNQVHPPLKHQCHICHKVVVSAKTLKKHMMLHVNSEPFHCAECGKSFKFKRYVTLHMRTHTGQYPTFNCKICHQTVSCEFRSKHMATHDVVKNFTCSFCPSAFIDDMGLKAHMRKHQDQYAMVPMENFVTLDEIPLSENDKKFF